ncbi:MAG: HU family DNA-binding protein [bacterium]
MNKEELVQKVAATTNSTQKEAAEIITATVNAITEAVAAGEKVTLVGFGTFEAKKRAARNGRNPQTGETIEISAKTVPTFTAGKAFKDSTNK